MPSEWQRARNAHIKAVAFDVGGVLVRDELMTGRQEWERKLGLAEGSISQAVYESPEAARAALGLIPEDELWKKVGRTLGIEDGQLGEFQRDFWIGTEVDNELAQFLGSLRPRYRTALLSNAWPSWRNAISDLYGLDKVVDLVVFSFDVGMAKPDPRIYAHLAETLELRPNEILFVDDTRANVEAAIAAGLSSVQFTCTRQAIEEVRAFLGIAENTNETV